VIRARNLGKRYRRVHEPPMLLRDMATIVSGGRRQVDEFWALRNVSFEVEQGEMLGIVGRNGSGKSTLLTLIAGTSFPDEGSVSTRGRLSVLLALGAGFNPDMTGEENIIVNAGLLGLSIPEARRRMRQIVEFAELEQVIDTKIRFYSSGMTARLGFAIAINVSPDILLVDEVLSVGDAGFQEKCFNEIRRMRAEGTTILFVSHGILSVQELCNRVLWLKDGVLERIGPADEVGWAYESYALGGDEAARAVIAERAALVLGAVPASLQTSESGPASRLDVADASRAHQLLEGFHEAEAGWRWTEARFVAELGTPPGAREHGCALRLKFWVSEHAALPPRGSAVSVSAGELVLLPLRFEHAGHHELVTRIPPQALQADTVKLSFTADTRVELPGDERELSLMVERIALVSDASGFEVGDTAYAHQLIDGLYAVENGWRWTKQRFVIDLAAHRDAATEGRTLRLNFWIPKQAFQRKKRVELSASCDGFKLARSFDRPGDQELSVHVPGKHLRQAIARFAFTVDARVELPDEDRELGVIVKRVALE